MNIYSRLRRRAATNPLLAAAVQRVARRDNIDVDVVIRRMAAERRTRRGIEIGRVAARMFGPRPSQIADCRRRELIRRAAFAAARASAVARRVTARRLFAPGVRAVSPMVAFGAPRGADTPDPPPPPDPTAAVRGPGARVGLVRAVSTEPAPLTTASLRVDVHASAPRLGRAAQEFAAPRGVLRAAVEPGGGRVSAARSEMTT